MPKSRRRYIKELSKTNPKNYNIKQMQKWLNKANQKISFGGAATLLVVVALAGQMLGFFRNRLVSTNFTVVDPGSSDAFFAAFRSRISFSTPLPLVR